MWSFRDSDRADRADQERTSDIRPNVERIVTVWRSDAFRLPVIN